MLWSVIVTKERIDFMRTHSHEHRQIRDVRFDFAKNVISAHGVRYINVAGQESDTPFDGVNIIVTTYTDGTTTTAKKVIK